MCNSKCGAGKGCCSVSMVAKVLLIVGGINWGLVGLGMLVGSTSDWNVVGWVLGSVPVLEALVYLLIGVAAVMKCFCCKCKKCMGGSATCSSEAGSDAGEMNKTM